MATPALGTIKLAMAGTNELFCREVVGNRNMAALDDLYTADAHLLPPGSPMVSSAK